jgi:flagellar motor switch/type III secretory pathway protein FliN
VLERQATQRAAELLDREQQISDQLSVAREQAGQVHASAARTADRLRQESEAAAEEARVRAATDLQRRRNHAAQEIARLEKIRVDVQAEIARLTATLTNALGASPAAVSDDTAPTAQ